MTRARKEHPLETTVPPALVWAIAFAGQWAVRRFGWLPIESPPGWLDPAGRGIASLGVVLGLAAVAQFVAARTTVDPHRVDRASALVTDGVYRVTRNPMYLALLLVLVGQAVRYLDPVGLLLAGAFVLWLNRFQIRPEERQLTELFGDDYAAFRQRTRRWI